MRNVLYYPEQYKDANAMASAEASFSISNMVKFTSDPKWSTLKLLCEITLEDNFGEHNALICKCRKTY